jgi:hypothetical protein
MLATALGMSYVELMRRIVESAARRCHDGPPRRGDPAGALAASPEDTRR